MKVKRIVANLTVSDPALAKQFYQDILGLDVLMDMGWIATHGSKQKMNQGIDAVPASCRYPFGGALFQFAHQLVALGRAANRLA
jgi:catechol 2,3-dioxygenase-like lactoylglutathione lyase family enzyme